MEQITDQLGLVDLSRNNGAPNGAPLLNMPSPVPAPPLQTTVGGNRVDTRLQNSQALSKLKPAFAGDFPFRKAFADTNSTVLSNHFVVTIDPNTKLYEYNILGVPNKIGKAKAKLLIQAMIDADPFLAGHQHEFATDCLTRIISWVKFPDLKPYTYFGNNGEGQQLRLQLLGEVNTQLLQSHTKARTAPTRPLVEDITTGGQRSVGGELGPVINALNIIISTALSDESILIKANKMFRMGGYEPLGSPTGSLCTIRGYFYTIKAGMGQMLLNLNICTSAFFRPMLVSDFLNDATTFLNMWERTDALRGLRVFITYERGGTNDNTQSRTKMITGTGEQVAQQTFQRSGNNGAPATSITVQDYLRQGNLLPHPWTGY
jgi:eukaryotic translation initiation factor 2C